MRAAISSSVHARTFGLISRPGASLPLSIKRFTVMRLFTIPAAFKFLNRHRLRWPVPNPAVTLCRSGTCSETLLVASRCGSPALGGPYASLLANKSKQHQSRTLRSSRTRENNICALQKRGKIPQERGRFSSRRRITSTFTGMKLSNSRRAFTPSRIEAASFQGWAEGPAPNSYSIAARRAISFGFSRRLSLA